MDDKSQLPYNLRLRKDHKASAALIEPSQNHKQDTYFQENEGEDVAVDYRCQKCGCSFHLQTTFHSHHCTNKSEKEGMENEVEESLGDNKSFRRRSRKGIPSRAPFF